MNEREVIKCLLNHFEGISNILFEKKKEITVDVEEHWLFTTGIRDVVELERCYYNEIETLFVSFVPSK